jgi:predicted O-methyltransferase YrrM
VITCEINPDHAEEARANFEKAGLSDVIEIIVGDARDTLRAQNSNVDLLFMDAEKEQYETYFDVVYKRIGVGGLFIADNAVSHADDLMDYISYVQNHPSLESVTVPVGKGLEVTVKVSG